MRTGHDTAGLLPKALCLALIGLLVGAFFCGEAIGQRLNLHGISHHFDTEFAYNNRNWGLAYEHEVHRNAAMRVSFSGGAYYNSVYKPTLYVAAAADGPATWFVRFGVVVIAATGYGGIHEDPTDRSLMRIPHTSVITVFPLPAVVVGRDVQVRFGLYPMPRNGFVSGQLSIQLFNPERP